jgi:hypothetical protein
MHRKVLIGIVLVLGGCVPSLYPLYNDKDLTFDPALLGQWTQADGKGTWAFTKAGGKEYRLVYTDNEGKQGRFHAHLLKLEGRLFLDLFPNRMDQDQKENYFYRLHMVPAHTFMRVDQIEPTLKMAYLHPQWIKKYLEEHPGAIRYETVENRIVLTAQTKQLQAFVLQHEKEAFHKMEGGMTREAEAKKR